MDLLNKQILENLYCWSGENLDGAGVSSELNIPQWKVYRLINKYNIQKFDISKEILEKLYYSDKKSIKDISKELDVSTTIIFNKMKEYNIIRRGRGKAGKENPFYGKSHTDETKKKLSEIMINSWEKNPDTYKNVFKSPSKETKKKMSKSAIKRVKERGLVVSYNPNSIDIIEEFARNNNYTLQHAENKGEAQFGRYFVDGYDSEHNVVVEYMEKHHNYNMEYDNNRRREIIDMIDCKYVEIWYDGNIKEFNTQ